MPLFVVVLLKRTSYNKETKREVENERKVKVEIKRQLWPILHQTQIAHRCLLKRPQFVLLFSILSVCIFLLV